MTTMTIRKDGETPPPQEVDQEEDRPRGERRRRGFFSGSSRQVLPHVGQLVALPVQRVLSRFNSERKEVNPRALKRIILCHV